MCQFWHVEKHVFFRHFLTFFNVKLIFLIKILFFLKKWSTRCWSILNRTENFFFISSEQKIDSLFFFESNSKILFLRFFIEGRKNQANEILILTWGGQNVRWSRTSIEVHEAEMNLEWCLDQRSILSDKNSAKKSTHFSSVKYQPHPGKK